MCNCPATTKGYRGPQPGAPPGRSPGDATEGDLARGLSGWDHKGGAALIATRSPSLAELSDLHCQRPWNLVVRVVAPLDFDHAQAAAAERDHVADPSRGRRSGGRRGLRR